MRNCRGVNDIMRKITELLIAAGLLLAMFGSIIIVPVKAYPRNVGHTIPSSYPYDTLADAIHYGNPAPGDMIFIMSGYTETLTGNLVVSTNYLWIVGAPASLGPIPSTIYLGGFSIQFTGIGQFLIGLTLIDTVPSSNPAIVIGTPVTGLPGDACSIWNNSLTGPGHGGGMGTGIEVYSDSNAIADNIISEWDIGVDLNGLFCVNNYVRTNTFGPWGTAALQAELSADHNVICHNNLNYVPSGAYFLDQTSTATNYFDDTTGYPLYGYGYPGYGPYREGNYYLGGVGAVYPVPPYYSEADNYPLLNPYSPLKADSDRDGQVGLADLIILAGAYGTSFGGCAPPTHGWDPRADVTNPFNSVGLSDLVTLALQYNRHDP